MCLCLWGGRRRVARRDWGWWLGGEGGSAFAYMRGSKMYRFLFIHIIPCGLD